MIGPFLHPYNVCEFYVVDSNVLNDVTALFPDNQIPVTLKYSNKTLALFTELFFFQQELLIL